MSTTHLLSVLDEEIERLISSFRLLDTRKPVKRISLNDERRYQEKQMKMKLLFGSDSDTDSDVEFMLNRATWLSLGGTLEACDIKIFPDSF